MECSIDATENRFNRKTITELEKSEEENGNIRF